MEVNYLDYMKEIKFALYAIKKNIQNSAELKTSFLMNVFGMAINNTAFIIIWVFFVKTVGVINGWTARDIIGLLGFGTICFGVVLSVGDGLRRLPDLVSSGSFDRFLLSPKNLLIRIATSSFGSSAVGDTIFGIVCLIFYGILIHATLLQVLLIIFLIIITTIIFLSLVIIIYSTSFLFVDSDQVTTGIFNFFLTPSLFNGGAFHGLMKFIFIFIVPSLLIGAIPVEIVRDISIGKLLLICILTLFWFFLSIKIFNKCVKKYESSNFMTFGN
jgi:ABC-2 type transport system permease protein